MSWSDNKELSLWSDVINGNSLKKYLDKNENISNYHNHQIAYLIRQKAIETKKKPYFVNIFAHDKFYYGLIITFFKPVLVKRLITIYPPVVWLKFKWLTCDLAKIWHFAHLRLTQLEFCYPLLLKMMLNMYF